MDGTATEKIIQTFRRWDSDGSGVISVAQLVELLHQLQPKWTKECVFKLIAEVDGDSGSSFVRYEPFLSKMLGVDASGPAPAMNEAPALVDPLEVLRWLPAEQLRDCELPFRMDGDIAVLSLGGAEDTLRPWGTSDREHRLDAAAVLALSVALDRAEKEGAKGLVIGAEGKYWCNGFDLKWMQAYPSSEGVNALQAATELLLARLLVFPMPTVAALNGHCTASGAMLALAMDFRHMDQDKGFVFVPGIDLGLTYSPGMSNLMRAKMPPHVQRDFIVYGQRFTAEKLSCCGLVDTAVPHAEVLTSAVGRAAELTAKAKHPQVLSSIKTTLYAEAVAALQLQSCSFTPMGFDVVPKGQDRPQTQAPQPDQAADGRDAIVSPGPAPSPLQFARGQSDTGHVARRSARAAQIRSITERLVETSLMDRAAGLHMLVVPKTGADDAPASPALCRNMTSPVRERAIR